MDLPDGFHWVKRTQYDVNEHAIALDRDVVAYVDSKAGGGWFARLECQQPFTAPIVTRQCSSLEAGLAGCAMWVCRHEVRLRGEVAERLERRRLNRHAAVR